MNLIKVKIYHGQFCKNMENQKWFDPIVQCAQSNVVSVIGKAAAHVQIIRLLNYIVLNCSKVIKTQALNCSKIIKTQAQSFMYNFPVVVMKSSFGERHELWTHDRH